MSLSGQQHTNVLASLRPAYITQLLGVSRQIIRHLGVSRLMYARHRVRVEAVGVFGSVDPNYQARSQDLKSRVHFRCQLTEGSVLVTQIFQLGSGGAL